MNQGSPPCLYIPEAEKQARCIDARLQLTVTTMSMASLILHALLISSLHGGHNTHKLIISNS
jgi:hypothetical protein